MYFLLFYGGKYGLVTTHSQMIYIILTRDSSGVLTWTLLAGILCHHHTCLVYWAGTQRDRRIEGGFEQFDGHLVEATQEVAALPRAGRRRGARVVGPSIKRQ